DRYARRQARAQGPVAFGEPYAGIERTGFDRRFGGMTSNLFFGGRINGAEILRGECDGRRNG
ncbi:MAG: hypothetical protein EBV29_12425, partial [Gammaproteobacteria bacterium]|nr:hypothetical protein [Gammaproteobacteria bacterium]